MRDCSRRARTGWGVALAAVGISAGACAAIQQDLRHAEIAYEEARYERALVWLESLERDVPDMTGDMRTRFYYMRGMSSFRLGRRGDARHYLALAREANAQRSAGLPPDWKRTLDRTLQEIEKPDTERPSPGPVSDDRL